MTFESGRPTLGAVGLIFCVSLARAQAPEPGEEWQMTMSMQMGTMSMPGRSVNQCVATSQQVVAPQAPDGNCTSTVLSQTADTVNMRFACTGKDAMEGTGTFTRTGKTMKGQMVMKTQAGDTMQMNYTGTNTGKACDAKATQRAAKAAIAQGAAQMDQMCTESARSGSQASMFFGPNAICKEAKYTTAYCANISGEKGYTILRTEEQSAKMMSQPSPVSQIESACSVSMPAMKSQLCSTAEQRKSWQFLAKECEAEAKTLAAQQCAGRGYTAMSTSPYKEFCGAYGAGGAAADAAVAPETPKPEDAVKRGLKGLKGKLGF